MVYTSSVPISSADINSFISLGYILRISHAIASADTTGMYLTMPIAVFITKHLRS